MLKTTVLETPKGRIVLMDSITKVTPEDRDAIVLSASHGGASSGEFALDVPLRLVLFNDAGVGRDDAGIKALAMLEARGIAGATIGHDSGRIGDARDMWENGVISHVNRGAEGFGLAKGQKAKEALSRLIA